MCNETLTDQNPRLKTIPTKVRSMVKETIDTHGPAALKELPHKVKEEIDNIKVTHPHTQNQHYIYIYIICPFQLI